MQPLCKLNIFKIFLPKRRHSTHKKLMSFIFSFGLSDPKGIHPPELESDYVEDVPSDLSSP